MTDNKIPQFKSWWIEWFWTENFRPLSLVTGCLNWKKSVNLQGYGRTSYQGVACFAHRMAYMLHYKTDPGDLLVRHTCHNRRCCNPEHLILGTHADNSQDMVDAGRSQKGDKHWMKRRPERLAELKASGGMNNTANLPNGEGHPCTVLNADIVREIRQRSVNGEGNRDLAREFGVTHSNISAIVLGKSWEHVEGPIKEKDTKWIKKLTEQDVREIRKKHVDGESREALAQEYKIGKTAIWKIINRKSWQHIE